MSTKLTDKAKLLRDTKVKIASLTNQLSSQGLLYSSTMSQGICGILLEQVVEFTKNENERVLSQICLGNIKEPNPKEFILLIENKTLNIINDFDSILMNSLSQSALADETRTGMLRSLNFRGQAEYAIKENCAKFGASYARELSNRRNQQTQINQGKTSNHIQARSFMAGIIIGILPFAYTIYKDMSNSIQPVQTKESHAFLSNSQVLDRKTTNAKEKSYITKNKLADLKIDYQYCSIHSLFKINY